MHYHAHIVGLAVTRDDAADEAQEQKESGRFSLPGGCFYLQQLAQKDLRIHGRALHQAIKETSGTVEHSVG